MQVAVYTHIHKRIIVVIFFGFCILFLYLFKYDDCFYVMGNGGFCNNISGITDFDHSFVQLSCLFSSNCVFVYMCYTPPKNNNGEGD